MKSPSKIYEDEFREIIEFVAINPGAIIRIAKEFARLTGYRAHRTQVSFWLSRDENRRMYPNYGKAIALKKASCNVIKEMEKEAKI